MPKEPKFDDNSDACGLEHATSCIVEPQTTLKAPHDSLPSTTSEAMPSASKLHPPALSASPPPSRIEKDPDIWLTTPTTLWITGLTYSPVFVHHALVNSPQGLAATFVPRQFNPIMFVITTPANVYPASMITIIDLDAINKACGHTFIKTPPIDPVPGKPTCSGQ